MPVVLVEGLGIFTLKFGAIGDPEVMVTTCGYFSNATLIVDVQGHADNVHGAWASAFPASALSSKYTYLGVDVIYNPSDGGLVEAAVNANVVGTGTASPLPSNCAYLVRKLTSAVGRKHKGRFFIPAMLLAESNVDNNGMLDTGSITGLQSRFDDFFTQLTTGFDPDINPLVLHNDNTVADVVNSFQVQPQIATQRRRMRP